MASGAACLADRRESLAGAVAVLRDLHTVLFQCPSGELADLAGDLAELRAVCGAQLVATVAEAERRGAVAESQHTSTTAWASDCAWHSRREAATIAKSARVLGRAELAPVAKAMLGVDIDPGTANVVAAEFDKLAPEVRPEAYPLILELMLGAAAEHRPEQVRRLREETLANYGRNGEFEDHTDRCRRFIDLSAGKQTSTGLWEYGLTVDAEGRAVLEAVIGPMSAPHVDPDIGDRDPRPVGQRRGQALIEALRRSITAAAHVPTSPKATLMLTMNYQDLAAQVGAGTVIGSRAVGTMISPETVRKLACDAHIIPAVLGGQGELLDQGRAQRLFTPAQIRALWLRDRHCSFPKCDAPAAWCDAHHLTHWIAGGATSLDNGALLCPRHHTLVHRDRLAGAVTPQGVAWDLRPGSYHPPDPPLPPERTAATMGAGPNRSRTAILRA